MLQAKTKEQKKAVAEKLYMCNYVGEINRDGIEVDGVVDFDTMADIVDYLRASDCKNRMLAKLEAHKQKIDYYYANQTIFFSKRKRCRKERNFYQILGRFGLRCRYVDGRVQQDRKDYDMKKSTIYLAIGNACFAFGLGLIYKPLVWIYFGLLLILAWVSAEIKNDKEE